MKLFLNNVIKGLLVSLVVITLGGFLYLNISKPEEINLKLVSSSVINQLETESSKIEDTKNESEKDTNKVLIDDIKEVIKEEFKDKDIDKETEIEEETPQIEENKEPVSENTENKSSSSNDNNNNQTITPQGSYAPSPVASTMQPLKSYTGKITAYGPDCVGCSGSVAHGEYVGGGNIYYQDNTFGSIRIVAGDRSLGFGTIVRISGLKNTNGPIIAIMLDTGGAIGLNKSIYFDLLYTSQREASVFGLQQATFEILRYGF